MKHYAPFSRNTKHVLLAALTAIIHKQGNKTLINRFNKFILPLFTRIFRY